MSRRGRPQTASDELRQNGYKHNGQYVVTGGLKPWHMRIVDFMLLNPNAKIVDIARHFEVTPQWIGQLIKTDAFQEYYHSRMGDHRDFMHEQIVTKMQGVAVKAFDKMAEKLDAPDAGFGQAQEAAETVLKGLGYGAKATSVGVNINGKDGQSIAVLVDQGVYDRAKSLMSERMKRNTEQVEHDHSNYTHVTSSLEVQYEAIDAENARDVTPDDDSHS